MSQLPEIDEEMVLVACGFKRKGDRILDEDGYVLGKELNNSMFHSVLVALAHWVPEMHYMLTRERWTIRIWKGAFPMVEGRTPAEAVYKLATMIGRSHHHTF